MLKNSFNIFNIQELTQKLLCLFLSLCGMTLFCIYIFNLYVWSVPKILILNFSLAFFFFALVFLLKAKVYNQIISKKISRYILTSFYVSFILILILSIVNFQNEFVKELTSILTFISLSLLYLLLNFKDSKRNSQNLFLFEENSLDIKERKLTFHFFKNFLVKNHVFIILIIISLIVKIYLINKLIIHPDEIYTHLVSLGYFKYGDIGTTLSGIQYLRTPFFNFLSSISYPIFDDKFFELRSFNALISTFFLILFFIINKKIFNGKVAIISVVLVVFSWYLNATYITARSYNVLIWVSYISISSLYLLLNEKSITKRKFYFALIPITLLLVFFEGHSLGFFHLILFFGIFVVYFFIKFKEYRKTFIYITTSILLIVGLYFYLFAADYFFYLLFKTFAPFFRIEQLSLFASFLSYFNSIGIYLILAILITVFFQKNWWIKALSLYVIAIILLQGYFWGKSSIDIRHFSDLLIPFYVIVAYIVYYLWRIELKLLSSIMIFSIVTTSLFGLYGISIQKISWSPYYTDSWPTESQKIPLNSIIISDYPDLIQFYREDAQIYAMNQNPFDHLYRDKYLNTNDPLETYTDIEKKRFKTFIEEVSEKQNVITLNQEFAKYSGIPKVMNIDHLTNIVESSNNKTVFFLVTHNFYDFNTQKNNPELYEFIIKNSKVISSSRSTQNFFDDQDYPYSYNRRLTLMSLTLE